MAIPVYTNTTSIPPLSESQEAEISPYHIVMPAFATFCIIINISVVFSSGLILKNSKLITTPQNESLN